MIATSTSESRRSPCRAGRRSGRLIVAAMWLGLTVAPAVAATIPVNNLTDMAVPGTCSLREAISAANTDGAEGGCPAGDGADTITFTGSGTILLAETLPLIATRISIDGRGQAVVLSGGHPRALFVRPDGTLHVEGITFRDNGRPLDVDDAGGAIQNEGTLSVTNCTFIGNFAQGGGAIVNGGAMIVTRSTFANNRARFGAAIYSADADATISNSTFSENEAEIGGAIVVLTSPEDTGNFTLINTTITANTASTGAGLASFGSVTMANTIIANSVGGDCFAAVPPVAPGPNLIEDGSCGAMLSGDPLLGPLANTGGGTATHALLPGSPAAGAGNTTICHASPVDGIDQRGEPRGTSACDLGSYESPKPLLPFRGFFAPVDNVPVLNVSNPGRAIPIRFSLNGDMGLDILSAAVSKPMACDLTGGSAAVEETVAPGGTGLTYDAVTDQYTFVWKTEKSWRGTCRQLVLTLSDGTDQRAYFQFK